MTSVLVAGADGRTQLVSKGAPEDLMRRCVAVPPRRRAVLDAQYAAGARVVAVAVRDAVPGSRITPDDEHGLTLVGFLVFVDRPKADASASLELLAELGIAVKIATGDNAKVAEKVCADLGMTSGGTLAGDDIDAPRRRRSSPKPPEQPRSSPASRPSRRRASSRCSARRGGQSPSSATESTTPWPFTVPTSASPSSPPPTSRRTLPTCCFSTRTSSVLADGVIEGRRIFANTIKYVLMGTSSNFGNMFSASIASVVLPFLPMLPGQILLNNLLYDTGQLAIPTDRVDAEQLRAPVALGHRVHPPLHAPVRPDQLHLRLRDLRADALRRSTRLRAEFRTGWFIESIATQTLIIFAIRTRRVPFFRSRPSLALAVASWPSSPSARGCRSRRSPGCSASRRIPLPFLLALVGMIVGIPGAGRGGEGLVLRPRCPRPPSAAGASGAVPAPGRPARGAVHAKSQAAG